MSLLAIAVVLGAGIVLSLKAGWVKPGAGLVCVLFGVLVASGPAGPPIQSALLDAGVWVDESLATL
jgi:hypothetical protein